MIVNKQIVAVSLALNVFLLVVLLWVRAEHQKSLLEMFDGARRGDELHMQLHVKSLAALESGEVEQVEETAAVLRKVVEGMQAGAETRRALRIGE